MADYKDLRHLGEHVSFIENKCVICENGRFYGITRSGERVEIEKEKIKEYALEIIALVNSFGDNIVNIFNLTCVLDQPIFHKENWKGIDRVDMLRIETLINKCKKNIKELPPEELKKIIDFAADSSDVTSIYLLELQKEGIVDSQDLIDSNFLSKFSRGLMTELCARKLIPIGILKNSKSIKGLEPKQIYRLVLEGFFDDIDVETLKKLSENGFLTPNGILKLEDNNKIEHETTLELFGGVENIGRLYRKSKSKADTQIYWDLLSPEDIIVLYSKGLMSFSEIDKLSEEISKIEGQGDLKEIKGEIGSYLVAIYLIERYNGKRLIELAKNNYIPSEILIELANKNDISGSENGLQKDELLKYYSPELISSLLTEKKVDSNFIKRIDQELLSDLDEDKRKQYIQMLLNKFKQKSSNDGEYYKKIIGELADFSDIPSEYFRNAGLHRDILDQYIDGEIPEEKIIDYYNSGILSTDELESIYDDNFSTVVGLLSEEKIDRRILADIPANALCDGLVDGKLGLIDVFESYAQYDGISASELGEIYGEYEEDYFLRQEEGEELPAKLKIVDLITDDMGIDKLRELYLHDVLSHSDIMNLKDKGIVTEEQANEISIIDRNRLYQQIFNGNIVSVHDDFEKSVDPGGDDHGDKKTKRQLIDSSIRREFFKRLGRCDFREVEAKEKDPAFKDYTLIGYPDYGVVVLENFQKDDNATYIMTLEEFKSFVTINDNGTVTIKKSKGAVKEERDRDNRNTIETPNHVATWGRNVIDALHKFSPEAKKSIGVNEHIELTHEMMDEYSENKSAKADDAGKARALIENGLAKSKAEKDILRKKRQEMRKRFKDIDEQLR